MLGTDGLHISPPLYFLSLLLFVIHCSAYRRISLQQLRRLGKPEEAR